MKADKVLEGNGGDFILVEQDQPSNSCEEAAKQRQIDISQIVKSLIVESDGEIVHVCIPGDRTLSEKKFGEHRLVDPDTSKEITGFESGTVHPLSSDLQHVIDERVFENERVSFTTGEADEGVILDSEVFMEVIGEEGFGVDIRDIVVTEDEDIKELESRGLGGQNARFLCEKGYRSIFLQLDEEFDTGEVIEGIRKLHREEINFGVEEVRKLLERAENENHMKKLAESLAEKGEMAEKTSDFDLEEVVSGAIDQNPEAVEDYREGRDSALNYLIGKIMEQTKGRASAEQARKTLMEELG